MLVAQAMTQPANAALLQDPAGIFTLLLAILAVIFWLTRRPVIGRLFKVVPSLIFCYFVPTALTTAGVIPAKSPLYDLVMGFVLPASLLLLILALDVPAIVRLGWKAVVMMLAGTAGVVIGGPVALLICKGILPADAWQGMAALSGSWIGGAANYVAIGKIAEAKSNMLAMMVVPDALISNIWLGVLLYLASREAVVDKWTGADAAAIRDLERRMTDFQQRTGRIASVAELMIILALAFGASWLSLEAGKWLPEINSARYGTIVSHVAWKYVIVTTIGVIMSFTKLRDLEGAGASRLGTLMLFLLVACIGAQADFRLIIDSPAFVLAAVIWMLIHITVLLGVGRLIRAPLFYAAVGSQANIGGAASAPIVAAAFHPSLAPVGALLAVAGYVMGTYMGWVCMRLLMAVAGVHAA